MDKFTPEDLQKEKFDKQTRPRAFYAGSIASPVADWAELSRVFVLWLINNRHLNFDQLPVPNHAYRGKYFINKKPCHEHLERDGDWRSVGTYWVDTKYNADSHRKNLLSTLKHLQVQSANIFFSFNVHK